MAALASWFGSLTRFWSYFGNIYLEHKKPYFSHASQHVHVLTVHPHSEPQLLWYEQKNALKSGFNAALTITELTELIHNQLRFSWRRFSTGLVKSLLGNKLQFCKNQNKSFSWKQNKSFITMKAILGVTEFNFSGNETETEGCGVFLLDVHISKMYFTLFLWLVWTPLFRLNLRLS